MRCKAKDILRLLKEIALEMGGALTHVQLIQMHKKIKETSRALGASAPDYLYRKLYLRVKEADTTHIRPLELNAQYIEAFANFLGYTNYEEFVRTQHPEKNPVLEKCTGAWYSYVRCNSGSADVLISPVHIFAKGKEIRMELKGPVRAFEGKVQLNENCLYCFLESGKKKNLHLVFNVGLSETPQVLQGVFSGISSGNDPIAGRELLVRRNEKFGELKNTKRRIADLLASEDELERKIGAYFSKREKNILKAGRASAFGIEDLSEEK